MPNTSPTRGANHGGDRSHAWSGREVLAFAIAAFLTLAMLAWQGNHLYATFTTAAHKQSGTCVTKLVEAVYFAGVRQTRLVDDLEHEVHAFGTTVMPAGVDEWRAHYDEASEELTAAIDAARGAATGSLADAVDGVALAHDVVDARVHEVLAGLSEPGPDPDLVSGVDYLAARTGLRFALDGLVGALDDHIESQIDAERRQEVGAVAGASGLFLLAIGAWFVFVRRIRVWRRLAAEEIERRRRAQADLVRARRMESLGLMAAGVAHDIENLTSVISGSTAGLRTCIGDPDEPCDHLSRIESATAEATALVEALRTFARDAPLRTQVADLHQTIGHLSPLVHAAVPPGVEVIIDLDPGLTVEVDVTRIEQAVLNLVLNAVEAMPDGGTLTISGHRQGEQVLLEVVDTGCGMTEAVRDRIFEPFFTTRPGSGSGLGLAIVHGVVTEHGGAIHVDSGPGRGAAFAISLPAAEAGAPEPGPERPSVVLAFEPGYGRSVVADALSAAGIAVRTCDTGDELAAALATGPVDAVLIGPGVTPPPVLRASPVATVIIAANGTDPPAHWTVLAGPVGISDLVDAVRRASPTGVAG